jgi:hypothetical protein
VSEKGTTWGQTLEKLLCRFEEEKKMQSISNLAYSKTAWHDITTLSLCIYLPPNTQ